MEFPPPMKRYNRVRIKIRMMSRHPQPHNGTSNARMTNPSYCNDALKKA